jgi:nucleoid-associated protein YgaU
MPAKSKKSKKKATKKSVKKTAKRSAKKTVKRSAKKTTKKKAGKRTVKKTVRKPVKRAAKKAKKPAKKKTAKRAAKRPAKKAAPKPAASQAPRPAAPAFGSSMPMGMPPAIGAPKRVKAEHTVAVGDSLRLIALKYYGPGGQENWKVIYDANKAVIGENPYILKPGQVLKIPEL